LEEGFVEKPSMTEQENRLRKIRFERDFYPHLGALLRFAKSLVKEENVTQDLVQETFIKAFRFMHYFEGGTNAKAWLFKILKNEFYSFYRKKSKEATFSGYDALEEETGEEDGLISTHGQNLSTEIFDQLIGDEMTLAINALPADYRMTFLLADLEGFSYEELAAIFQVPIGTVRSRLHRARNFLKKQLTSYAKGLGYKTEDEDDGL
jgi:RNA polymerase sigma-70 factor (ECF subfamily)